MVVSSYASVSADLGPNDLRIANVYSMKVEISTRYHAHGLWVTESALGRQFDFMRDGATVQIQLPSSPDDFQALDTEDVVPPIPACHQPQQVTDPTYPETAIAINLFVVSLTVGGSELRRSVPQSEEFWRLGQDLCARWRPLSDRLAYEFLGWLRVLGRQDWLGLTTYLPVQYGRTGFYESGTGNDLFGIGPDWSATFRSPRLAIDPVTIDQCSGRLQRQEELDTADALMADARYLSADASSSDSTRAVLSLAIAAELKVKTVLRSIAQGTDPSLELMELIDRASALEKLTNETVSKVADQSLKVANRDLYNSIRRLGKKRDRIMHRGESASTQEAQEWLRSVPELIQWLGQISEEPPRYPV